MADYSRTVLCGACNKENPCDVNKCQVCGASLPGSASQQPIQPGDAPFPGQVQPFTAKLNAKSGCMGCLGLVALWFVVFWVADFAGCQWAKTDLTTGPSAQGTLTKAEWRSKLRNNFPGFGNNQIVMATTFKSAMGEPARTQSLGNQAYWYYDCSDGGIQVVLDDPNTFGNMACIKNVNEY